jgi:serine/threonine protein kinase
MAEVIEKEVYTAFDPPEAVLKKPTVGFLADCWALGVVLYALVTRHRPWEGQTPGELYYAMTCGNVLKPQGMSTGCHALILRFLDQTPNRRFSALMAKQQGWVGGKTAPVRGVRFQYVTVPSRNSTRLRSPLPTLRPLKISPSEVENYE